MSLTFKLLSLAIRTAAKPIGNYIKRQAKEHDGFRRFAVAQAQRVHRIDMRMRLGILHDPEAQQRMHEREQRAADEKKRQAEAPTVRTEAEQRKYDADKAKDEKDGPKKEEKPRKVQIRPLSETRAIELGANFFSEAFIFAVAAGLLIWDSWRSRRKESQRRDDVADRLQELEGEIAALKSTVQPDSDDVNRLIERVKEAKRSKPSWWQSIIWSQEPSEPPKNQSSTQSSESLSRLKERASATEAGQEENNSASHKAQGEPDKSKDQARTGSPSSPTGSSVTPLAKTK